MIKKFTNRILLFFFFTLASVSLAGQGTYVDFNTIPKSGTILIYAHNDDDLIWMLPFWNKTEKFIGGAMPNTPNFQAIVDDQQTFMDNNGYNIQYASNWYTPWGMISQQEYSEYYWHDAADRQYLAVDHLIAFWDNNNPVIVRTEINRIKAKIEEFIADPSVERIITHNNWGEYGHPQHVALSVAVRELAVKYRKDVWMLGCTTYGGPFVEVGVPNGITYTMGDFNTPSLFTGIRSIYQYYYCWTWYSDLVPSGQHTFMKIVDDGSDKSNILRGESITYPGPYQEEAGAYIFDGDDDYLTLAGNNNPSFTIAMKVRPSVLRAMDISRMAEYHTSGTFDRIFYMNADGRVSARINDGSSRTVTSVSSLEENEWAHIAMTGNGSSLKIYVNGSLENTVPAGTAITSYSSPEFVIGHPAVTGSYFEGQISNLRMFDHVLTDNEIAQLSGMVYNISASAGPGGSISPSGTITQNVGTSRNFTITPSDGYKISDVKVDNNSVGAVSNYTFDNIRANHTITASFEPVTFTITASAGTGGSITPTGAVEVVMGANRTFTITPATGYRISDVLIDNVSSGPVTTQTFVGVHSDHTIHALFTPLSYIITATAGTGGSITPAGEVTAAYGTNRTFNITPDAGFMITDVRVDGVSVGIVTSYTINNIRENHTITASFDVIVTHIINATSGTGGSITPSGNVEVTQGLNRSFVIAAETGYLIEDVKVDGVSVGAVTNYTFTNVTSAHTISVTFIPIPTYTITVSAGTGGTVTPSGVITLNQGSVRTFNINPGTGYDISDVLVDNVSVGPVTSYTFNNIIADHTISATFSISTYTITASSGAGGSISPSGTLTLDYGSSQTYNITPGTGYRIADVRIDNVSAGALTSYSFSSVSANHTISATFTPLTYILAASAGSGGSISPSGNVSVNYGTNRTFTITPNSGYHVTDVLVDEVSVGAVTSHTFNNITANHTITAAFAINTYTITGSSGPNGSINPTGVVNVNHGSSRSFTISPSVGYQIADVLVDNSSAGDISSYTFSNITASHTISATFEVATYTIAATAGTGGTVTPAGTITMTHGSNRTYTITPNTGYQISDVRIDNVSVGAVNSFTFSNVTEDHTISATFTPITFTITASAGSGGTISPSGNVIVNYGTNRSFTITPNAGYHITDVRVDNVSIGDESTFTFSNVTSAHSISATFAINTYTVTSSAGDHGTIAPSGVIELDHGSTRSYLITPDVGYHISDVRVDNNSVGAVSSYTFNSLSASHTIRALFEINTYTVSASAGTGGSISPTGSVGIVHGESRTFLITPDNGYHITDVRVDNVSRGPLTSYSFSNVTGNHSIAAAFAINTYTITAAAGNGGTISPAGNISINHGSNRSFTITPDRGYRVLDVKIDNVSIGAPGTYSFTNVTANHSIAVTFTQLNYVINVIQGNGGTISPSGSVGVNYGDRRTFTISPDPGYRIADVKVDNVSIGVVTEYAFNSISADHTISATFARITYTIQGIAGQNGTISPAGNITVNHGETQVYTFTPNAGYRVADVLVDNNSVGQPASFSFTGITAGHRIEVIFTLITFKITGVAGTGGSIEPSGTIELRKGSGQVFTITPNEGFRILDVKIDGVSAGAVESLDLSDIMDNHTVTALFAPLIVHTINSASGTGGSITPSGLMSAYDGSEMKFVINPGIGFRIQDVLIDNRPVGPVAEYTFEDIKSSHTILVKFSSETSVNVYPNPFDEEFTFEIRAPGSPVYDISIADMSDKIVFVRNKIPANQEIQINPGLKSGLYFLRVYSQGRKVAILRIIRQ